MVEPTRDQKHGRFVLGLMLALGVASAVVSCQKKSEPMGHGSASGTGAGGATTRPTTGTEAAVSTAAPMPEPIRWREMGFGFPPAPGAKRSAEEITMANATCVACHTGSDSHTMHESDQGISCVDCHGGKNDVQVPGGIAKDDRNYARLQDEAHVHPKLKDLWKTSANPKIAGPRSMHESVDFIRFINPGDLRVANVACGACHAQEVKHVTTSMMAHGAMLWSAALYNNGSINRKNAYFGESYGVDGTPRAVVQLPRPTAEEVTFRGIMPTLYPLPRWEITQPGNILRVFERGGKVRPQIALPNALAEIDPGRPDVKLSVRGVGTDVRTDPVMIGLQKTRLLDPTLNMIGTNDHPGDYRSSGCSACHVVYANDRSPAHSGRWAQYGNMGMTATKDPTIPKDESGHPIEHKFVKNMPTSTCIVCHIHPGTNVVNSYLGYMWWDNESDGEFMYPKNGVKVSNDVAWEVSQHNPEEAAARGLWSNKYPHLENHMGQKAGEQFLEKTSELNPQLKHVQFGDFHGHGWVFRQVHKRDRRGNLLDKEGAKVAHDDPKKFDKAVHLKDIHLEKGMHCVDCHFQIDNHGDGNLYGETRAAVMVECQDCHGSVNEPANLFKYLNDRRGRDADKFVAGAFTGNAAPKPTAEEISKRKQFIGARFEVRDNKLWQKSAIEPDKGWFVVQTTDTMSNDTWWAKEETVGEKTATRARYAHTVRKDGKTWGSAPSPEEMKDPNLGLAHGDNMSCYACHTSWNTSCFGCHLPQRANQRKEMQHNEGAITRNYTNYNFQTLRDDVYMLGIDSTVKKNQIVPIRSACAVMVSSQDALRQWIYTQQQTVSAEGYAGTAFSPYFPHTVRATETKQCTDCHISKENDNNAVMAQLMLHGTNAVNFIGRHAFVALGEHGFQAVGVTEIDEPQAVIGSKLHSLAYPQQFARHQERGGKLADAKTHHGRGEVLDVQMRGEYLYAACGPAGFWAFDIANIENKGFSERIVTAPVSPLGQKFFVDTKYATSVTSPSTMALDPTRPRRPENQEGRITPAGDPKTELRVEPIHLMYAFLYVTDKYEGLVVIGNPLDDKKNKPGVATLLDGNPSNNFLKRAYAFNPGGVLNGARDMEFHGTLAYVCADSGVSVIDFANPLEPKLVTTLAGFSGARKIQFQFRYGWVCDNEGVKTIDVTDPRNPKIVQGATVQIGDARDIYVSRTWGYVAAGSDGLVVLDLERPEAPKVEMTYNADGKMNDANAVRVGMTNSNLYAYVADGHNGLKVLQLTAADSDTPGYLGFAARPNPKLIAWYKTAGHALSISEGLDRDRAVDEAGYQLGVFGRRGARPFTLEEQQKLYLRKNSDGTMSLRTVTNEPGSDMTEVKPKAAAPPPQQEAPRPSGGGLRIPGRRPTQ